MLHKEPLQKVKSKNLRDAGNKDPLAEIINLMPFAAYTCDAKGLIQFFNLAAVELWGRTPEIGKDHWCGSWKIFNATDGTTIELDSCPMAKTLSEGTAGTGEEIIIERPDGIRRYVIVYPRPLFDNKGIVAGAINFLIDVTDQRQIQQVLSEGEERFKMIAELAPIVIWMCDSEGNCTYLNSRWTELTGSPLTEGYGSNWQKLVHPDERKRAMDQFNDAAKGKQPFSGKYLYKNNKGQFTYHLLNASPRIDPNGNLMGYVGTLTSIEKEEQVRESLEKNLTATTEDLIRMNAELRISEERYHRMVSEVQDYAILLLSREGIIENWNVGAEKIKKYSAEEAIGNHFRIFYLPEDRERKLPERLLQKAAAEGKAIHEGWRLRKDGTKFWGSILITAIHNNNNEVIGFSKVTRDLSEMKAAQDALAEKNRTLEKVNQELTSFAYVSSHDLQEPLRKIHTFSTRILEMDRDKLSEKGKDYFNRIQLASLSMRTLIDDLLTYSRLNTFERKFSMVDLNEMFGQIADDLSERIEEKKAVLNWAALPRVYVIPFQIRQMFSNLLNNALKFSKKDVPPGIEIKSEIVKGMDIPVTVEDKLKLYHRISVADNGIGFRTEYGERVFEVFQRLHGKHEFEGTGVGLAICRKIADNHDGFILAEGKENVGATFYVYLPV